MNDRNYITVSELNKFIGNIVDSEDLLRSVPVVGEVSGFSTVKNNSYFTLKDDFSQIRVIVFDGRSNGYVPHNGEQVLAVGYVSYYQKTGQISLKAYKVAPFGAGQMHAALEALKEKLTAEGLFDENRKKAIPAHPRKIAVITSVKGAALQDFLTTLAKHNSEQEISVVDVRVQGESCVRDIVTALTYCDAYGFDVVIIARGGGSFEDLYCFNDERLVRAIYGMTTPVISAVGHETDYSLCDMAADYRAITPTAAAEKVAFDTSAERKKIYDLVNKISRMANYTFDEAKEQLFDVSEDIKNSSNRILKHQYELLKNSLNLIKIFTTHTFEAKQANITNIMTRIDDLSPIKLLNRGYFRILYNGKQINDFKKINKNDQIRIIGAREKISAIVTDKEER
jgi:exodeoxyribonuclease VII large subunit